MAKILLVQYAPTKNTKDLAAAVAAAKDYPELIAANFIRINPLDPDLTHFNDCAGVVLGTPANFGYMSGALKHFFDLVFPIAGGELTENGTPANRPQNRIPYSYWVHGRYDTTGASRAITSIATGLGWRLVSKPLEILGEVTSENLTQATELAGTVAAVGLETS